MFYVALNKRGINATKRTILQHGGKLVEHPGDAGSAVISLVQPDARATREGRPAYSVKFVRDCVESGTLLQLEPFRLEPVGNRKKRGAEHQERDDDAEHQHQERDDDAEHHHPAPHHHPQQQTDTPPKHPATPEKDASKYCFTPKKRASLTAHEPTASDTGCAQKPETNAEEETQPPPAHLMHAATQSQDINHVDQNMPDSKQPSHHNPSSQKDTVPWTPEEDKYIAEICTSAMDCLSGHNTDDVSTILNLHKFQGLRQRGDEFLPPNRTAEECLARALTQWSSMKQKKTPKKRPGPARRTRSQLTNDDQSAVSDTSHDNPETPQTYPRKQKAKPSPEREHHGMNGSAKRRRTTSETPEKAARPPSDDDIVPDRPVKKRRATDGGGQADSAKRQKVFQLVKKIARFGKVSERAAFRALRSQGADWKRALRFIKNRRKTTDV